MPLSADIVETLRLELRRGTLILAVLGALRAEKYGYTLRSELAEQGIEIDEGALYPMLRRLETQGLLTSEWREDAKRQKRFYRLSPDGAGALAQLAGEWRAMNRALEQILDPPHAAADLKKTGLKEAG
jgi:PadR family transcriptional regulator, regulatory protein PadR